MSLLVAAATFLIGISPTAESAKAAVHNTDNNATVRVFVLFIILLLKYIIYNHRNAADLTKRTSSVHRAAKRPCKLFFFKTRTAESRSHAARLCNRKKDNSLLYLIFYMKQVQLQYKFLH